MLFESAKPLWHTLPDIQESMPNALDISSTLLNKEWDEVRLLMVDIVGFLKSSLIAALLKMCLTPQCANQYSSSQEHGDHWSISSVEIYLLLEAYILSRGTFVFLYIWYSEHVLYACMRTQLASPAESGISSWARNDHHLREIMHLPNWSHTSGR